MKVETQVEHNKWLQLQNSIHKTRQPLSKTSTMRLLLIDNFFIFLLQFAGYSLNHYITEQPLIFISTGIGLALLFLKGNAIVPGLLLSAFISQVSVHDTLLHASYFACYQIIPLVLCRTFIHRYIGASMIIGMTGSLWQQALMYIAIIVTAGSITLGGYVVSPTMNIETTWMANLNGLLIMSMTVLLLDLYFVDWCETLYKERMALCLLLLLWLFFLACSLSIIHVTWGYWLLLTSSWLLLYWFTQIPYLLGIISALFIAALLQLGLSFFFVYPIKTAWLWQSLLFLDTVYAIYLIKKESATT